MDLFSHIPEAEHAPAVPNAPTQERMHEHGEHIPYQPATSGRGDDKAQALFSAKSSTYETAKKSNHSTREIPSEIIDKVEEGEVTYEAIKRLANGHPIYVYQTCLTIHGRWPQVKRSTIGGYKHLRQNANGSMEVLWPAIDYSKKVRVSNELRAIGAEVEYRHNSSESKYVDTVRVHDEETWNSTVKRFRAIMERVKRSGAIANSTVYRMNVWGLLTLALEVNVQAIPAGSERALTLALANLDTELQYAHARDVQAKKVRQEQDRWKKAEEERMKEQQQRQAKQQAQDREDIPKLEAWLDKHTTRQVATDTPVIGQTYSKLVRTRQGNPVIRQLRWEKGTFGRLVPYTWIGDEQPEKEKQCKPEEYRKWPNGWVRNK